MGKMRTLETQFDNAKSFYGKAQVEYSDCGKDLYSYGTHVAGVFVDFDNKRVAFVNDTYSATTLRHIKEFLKQNGFKAETKAQIIADYMN